MLTVCSFGFFKGNAYEMENHIYLRTLKFKIGIDSDNETVRELLESSKIKQTIRTFAFSVDIIHR